MTEKLYLTISVFAHSLVMDYTLYCKAEYYKKLQLRAFKRQTLIITIDEKIL